MRVNLKGHMLVSESIFDGAHLCDVSHAFYDDVFIGPGLYVVLYSGEGVSGWRKSRDGNTVFHAYADRDSSIWTSCGLPLHLLNTQHTYVERGEPLLLR